MNKLHYFDTIKPGLPFEQARFIQPDTCFYPVFAWVWNDVLDKSEIKKQIDEMLEGGIRNFYIIPEPKDFRPNTMVTRLEPDYLSDEFMEFVKFTADYAAEKGMYMWLYDEGGWPSGSATGKVVKNKPETIQKRLSCRKISVKKGETYTIPSDVKASFLENQRIFSGSVFESDVTISEFFVSKDEGHWADVSEKLTTETFINLTHEKYKQYIGHHFGKTVPFMFTDEPALEMPTFSYDFETRFKAKYNYDILDFLPVITKGCGKNDSENQIRSDYFTLCGEIFNENFLKMQADWCEKNGIFFTGHLDNDHRCDWNVNQGYTTHTDSLSNLHVPGIDVIWRQIFREKDTNDAMKFFPRVAASAAAKSGKNLTVSETFGVYGSGLTANEMRYIMNFQFLRGINIMNFMNISYGRKDFLAFAERPSFGKEKPGYDALTAINDYVARMSYLTTVGKSGADTLLYLPVKDIHSGGEIRGKAVRNFYDLGNKLENLGIDFHICDDFTLKDLKIEDNMLKIGEASYKNICIPDCKYIPNELKQKIQPFIAEPTPLCDSSNGFSDIKVSKRILENGDEIYFFFNESESKKDTVVTFKNKKIVYELNAVNGETYLLSYNNKASISVESGEIKCIFLSNDRFKTGTLPHDLPFGDEIQLTDFQISKKSAFILSKNGGYKENHPENFISAPLGSWKTHFGEDFSGDVIYRTSIELESEPRGVALLSLGKIAYSAEVKVNGKHCGFGIFEPMELIIDGENFTKGSNLIEITVSNTAANQFVLSGADKLFEPKEIGPYNERSKEFEKESLDGGLYGPVTVKFSK